MNLLKIIILIILSSFFITACGSGENDGDNNDSVNKKPKCEKCKDDDNSNNDNNRHRNNIQFVNEAIVLEYIDEVNNNVGELNNIDDISFILGSLSFELKSEILNQHPMLRQFSKVFDKINYDTNLELIHLGFDTEEKYWRGLDEGHSKEIKNFINNKLNRILNK